MNKISQFFNNYDYIENSSGPGKGFYGDMSKQKSVKDFFKKKKTRKKYYKSLLKAAQEKYIVDETLTGLPSTDSTYLNSIPTGGLGDYGTPLNLNKNDSVKGLSGDYLLNGQKDYQQDNPVGEKYLNEYLSPEESSIYGLDLDIDKSDLENHKPRHNKYNVTDLKQDTFRDIKPYP